MLYINDGVQQVTFVKLSLRALLWRGKDSALRRNWVLKIWGARVVYWSRCNILEIGITHTNRKSPSSSLHWHNINHAAKGTIFPSLSLSLQDLYRLDRKPVPAIFPLPPSFGKVSARAIGVPLSPHTARDIVAVLATVRSHLSLLYRRLWIMGARATRFVV